MALARIASDAERASCARTIDGWARARLAEGASLVAVDRHLHEDRWYLRLRGEEKDFVTVWLTMRQRTLGHEAQLMPAPETNTRETYEYLLRRNSEIRQMRFALGPENAVYLVGEIPVSEVNDDELDRVVGSSLAYVDATFPTAMTVGFAGLYRRKRGS